MKKDHTNARYPLARARLIYEELGYFTEVGVAWRDDTGKLSWKRKIAGDKLALASPAHCDVVLFSYGLRRDIAFPELAEAALGCSHNENDFVAGTDFLCDLEVELTGMFKVIDTSQRRLREILQKQKSAPGTGQNEVSAKRVADKVTELRRLIAAWKRVKRLFIKFQASLWSHNVVLRKMDTSPLASIHPYHTLNRLIMDAVKLEQARSTALSISASSQMIAMLRNQRRSAGRGAEDRVMNFQKRRNLIKKVHSTLRQPTAEQVARALSGKIDPVTNVKIEVERAKGKISAIRWGGSEPEYDDKDHIMQIGRLRNVLTPIRRKQKV